MRHPRRRFLAHALLGAGAPLWPAPWAVAAQSPVQLLPRRLFFARADYNSVRLSPDGTRLAYLAPANRVLNVFVAPVSNPRAARQVTDVTDRDVSFRFEWAYDNRHIVFFRDRDGDENWRALSVDVDGGAVRTLTPETGVRALVQEVSHLYPTEMLLGRASVPGEPRVCRVERELPRLDPDEGHGFVRHENRMAFFAVVEAFLARHLGGRCEPIGDEFKGSSIVVQTGAELVPGLGAQGAPPAHPTSA